MPASAPAVRKVAPDGGDGGAQVAAQPLAGCEEHGWQHHGRGKLDQANLDVGPRQVEPGPRLEPG